MRLCVKGEMSACFVAFSFVFLSYLFPSGSGSTTLEVGRGVDGMASYSSGVGVEAELLRFLYFLPRLLPFLVGVVGADGVAGKVGSGVDVCTNIEGDKDDNAADAGVVICMAAREEVGGV
jgi:hypothetical protein